METRARYILVGVFTLIVVGAGFAFVYWLNNSGGLTRRAVYDVRFESAVSGMQTGSAVQFNGIRVGEVTGLRLDATEPRRVTATIAVDPSTPIRSDTRVGIEFQGLMGSPAIALEGGSSSMPPLHPIENQPPLLTAESAAGQTLTQAVRTVLQHVDAILSDNSDSLKSTMDNLKTFTGALARNSDKIEGVLSGLQRLAGGGAEEKLKPVYDLTIPGTFPTTAAAPRGPLVIPEPTAVVAFATQRMLARSADGRITFIGEAQWSDSLPKLVQEKVIQSFENAGFIASVVPPIDRITTTYQLVIDLRSFAVTTSGEPAAQIEFSAKVVADDGHVVGGRLFSASVPTTGSDEAATAAAFDRAFGKAVTELVVWTASVL